MLSNRSMTNQLLTTHLAKPLSQWVNRLKTPLAAHLSGIKPYRKGNNALWQIFLSDENLEEAFTWLCKQSKDSHHNNDVWDFRMHWAQHKGQISEQLSAGTFAFEAARIVEMRNDDGQYERREVRTAQDRLVIRALSRRDKKLTQLYERGASKRRIGLYLARWLCWASILASGSAHAACGSYLPDATQCLCFDPSAPTPFVTSGTWDNNDGSVTTSADANIGYCTDSSDTECNAPRPAGLTNGSTLYLKNTSSGTPDFLKCDVTFGSGFISASHTPGPTNTPPSVTSTSSSLAVNDNATATPFANVVLADADTDNLSVSITLDTPAKGSLSASSIATGAIATVQTALRAIVFTPTANRVAVGSTETTTFTLTVNDGTVDTDDSSTTVISASINDAPTDIALDSSNVNQTDGVNAVVGALSSPDVDPSDTHTYTFVAGSGDTDNASFNVDTANLRANDTSALTAGSYSVRIQTDDVSSGTFVKALTITVVDDVKPILAEVTAVTTPSGDTTPAYTFSSDEAGASSYGGDCSGTGAGTATAANNTVNLSVGAGTHTNCTVTVTDAAGNASDPLAITGFTTEVATISAATYDAATGNLVVTSVDLEALAGDDIIANTLTLTGEGTATYTLTDTANVERDSATAFTLTLSATDQINVEGLLNKDGASSDDSTAYNLAAGVGFNGNDSPADTTATITVSNTAAPSINSATYNAITSTLTVTGTNFVKKVGNTNDIDISTLTFTGNAGGTYPLIGSTDVEITSATEFSLTLSGADETNVNALLDTSGTSASDSTVYNLAAADNWLTGAAASTDIADTTSNAITVTQYTFTVAKTTDGAEANGGIPTAAVFTVTVSPTNATGSAITGSIAYSGTATNGTDYATGATTFSIANSSSTATITLDITEDTDVEGTETAIATISSPSTGSIGTAVASADITDDDSYSISIAKTTDGVENNTGSTTDAVLTITVTPSNVTGSAITGNIIYTGTATEGSDYATGASSFSIANNSSSTTISLNISEDALVEAAETIISTLSSPSVGILATAAATATISDDDNAPVFTNNNSLNIIEANTAVITTVATDADGDSVSYLLNGGADVLLFDLTSAGVLSFKTAPTTASPSDSGGDNTYNVTVQASDGSNSTDQALSIIVISAGNVSDDTDANNNGITDKLEQNYGTTDSDNDGLPDSLETLLKGNLDDLTASTDSDGDGMPDIAEVMLGRDPTADDNSSANAPSITVTASPLALRAKATLSTYSQTDLGVSASDSLTPVAYYKNGACETAVPYNYKTVCNAVPVSGYRSGTQNIWWLLTDSTGNWGKAEQVLQIVPSVSFTNDLILSKILESSPNTRDIRVNLSGSLVDSSMSLTIPYTVTGTAVNPDKHNLSAGNFTVPAGQLVSNAVTISLSEETPVNNSTIIVTLDTSDPVFASASGSLTFTDTERVLAGSKLTQTITLKDGTQQFPPRLANLKGTQGSDASEVIGLLFDKTAGDVTLSFDTHDPDSGTYSYSWANSNNALVLSSNPLLLLSASTSSSPSVKIDALDAGNYYIEVQVTDSTAPLDSRNPAKLGVMLTIPDTISLLSTTDSDGDGINDAVEGLKDSDGDGRPDYLDTFDTPPHFASTSDTEQESFLMKASPGLKVKVGTTAVARSKNSTKITKDDLASDGDGQGGSTTNAELSNGTLDHIFDYEIEEIEVPSDPTADGKSIIIVLPLTAALGVDDEFKKYDSAGGWKDFVSDANNRIEWANWLDNVEGNCPDPDPILEVDETLKAYNNSSAKTGKTCIQLILQDGGANDADGVVDGRIIDPFGIATPTPVVSTGGGSTYVPPVDPCANMGSITGSAPPEGECDFTNYFILSLEPALTIDATVDFATRDGSAKAGEDYVATSGTITIPAGETQALIPVKILTDSYAEDDESFDIVLTNPVGASFPIGVTEIVATHTILNGNDTSYAIAPSSVTSQSLTTEGSTNNHTNYFKLALDKAYDTDIFVSYHTEDGTATAGKDYIAISRKVKIAAGTTEVMIGVIILADTEVEADETFSLVISNPIGQGFPEGVSKITATHTIVDDD